MKNDPLKIFDCSASISLSKEQASICLKELNESSHFYLFTYGAEFLYENALKKLESLASDEKRKIRLTIGESLMIEFALRTQEEETKTGSHVKKAFCVRNDLETAFENATNVIFRVSDRVQRREMLERMGRHLRQLENLDQSLNECERLNTLKK